MSGTIRLNGLQNSEFSDYFRNQTVPYNFLKIITRHISCQHFCHFEYSRFRPAQQAGANGKMQ